MDMFALLTLPRGVPIDPEPLPPPARDGGEAPVGIIIRPGPAPAGCARRSGTRSPPPGRDAPAARRRGAPACAVLDSTRER